jgi:hypothetical protein
VRLGGNRHDDRINTRPHIRGVGEGPRPARGSDLRSPIGPGIHDANEIDILHDRQEACVMLAEVTDADDGNAKTRH